MLARTGRPVLISPFQQRGRDFAGRSIGRPLRKVRTRGSDGVCIIPLRASCNPYARMHTVTHHESSHPDLRVPSKDFSGSPSPQGLLNLRQRGSKASPRSTRSRTINPRSSVRILHLPIRISRPKRPWHFLADFAACQGIPHVCTHITQSTRQGWNSGSV
ncbi:hypothetical protein FKP32DRAFT_350172 [Trametes sanguinea]|nr:hypothetical protein FKP32DRAFT_350172 [Trametes sanguinea]